MQQLNGKMRTFGAADTIKKSVKVFLPALAWVCGLLLAGSDGPWMPYINVVGGLIFFGASLWLGRILPGVEKNKGVVETFSCPPMVNHSHIKSVPPKIQPGYGGSLVWNDCFLSSLKKLQIKKKYEQFY